MKKRFLVAVLAFGMLLSGCGSSKYSTSGSFESMKENAFVTAEEAFIENTAAPMQAPGAAGGLSVDADQVTESAASSRKIIYRYNISAETKDSDSTVAILKDACNAAGGYIESQYSFTGSRYYDGSTYTNTEFTFRIPAKNVTLFMTALEGSCNITDYNMNSEDVTLKYVDLESHVSALRAEQKRLNELMEKADTVEDLITIESRLSDIRYQVESYQSQLRTYDSQIDYTTIYLNLNEVKTLTVVEPTVGQRIKDGFVENLKDVGEGILDFVVGFITHIPSIILFIVFLGIAFIIVKLCMKLSYNIKRRKVKKAYEKEQKAMAASSDSAKSDNRKE